MSEQLEEILTRMVSKSEDQQAQILHQQNQITSLIQALQQMPGVQRAVEVTVNPAAVAAETIRAEKVQKLALNMRKSNRFKTFKVHADSDVKLFIKKFDEELKSLKLMVGIDDDLKKEEYVPIFRASLDFPVIERVEQVLKKLNKDWANVTIAELVKLMKDEFGAKHTDVANVLQQFGPSRLTKSQDQSVQEFYFQWSQNIPEVMKPSTEEENKDFVDLIYRAMYYISLDDKYLQQALSDLKTPNPTIKNYFDETVAAESRRKCFQDISTSSSSLDNKGVTISKWDANYTHKKKFNNKSESKTADKSVRPKGSSQSDVSDNTQGKNSKGGNKGQKQNSDQKSKQQNSESDTKRDRWCD